MATNPIYVETEEEIPELVERLRRYHGEDTMLVLPMRSRIGQSRFNFQLLRNYSARLGKRVTVVCDDPAVQKMASESGFAVFGAVGPQGEGIPSDGEAPAPVRRWWQRRAAAPTTHVGVGAPTRLLTKTATELKPGRFLLYVTAITLILVGVFAAAVFVPSASVTLVAQAQPFSEKDVEIQAQPGKPPIKVRPVVIAKSNSQGFKVTGSIDVPLAPSTGQVVYTNDLKPTFGTNSPGLVFRYGQRLLNTNGLEFAQTSGDTIVPWNAGRQAGERLAETIIFGPPQYTTDHQPQEKVPSFTGTMTVTGEGDFYSDADVIQAYKTYLAQRVPNDQQLLTESPIQVTYRLLSSAKGGFLVFVGNASAYVAPKLDEEKIRAQIVGRPVAQARFYLEKLPIRSVAIKEQPLALPLMPLLDRRIQLHYVVESNAPSAEAASAGTTTASPSPHSP